MMNAAMTPQCMTLSIDQHSFGWGFFWEMFFDVTGMFAIPNKTEFLTVIFITGDQSPLRRFFAHIGFVPIPQRQQKPIYNFLRNPKKKITLIFFSVFGATENCFFFIGAIHFCVVSCGDRGSPDLI